MKLSVDTKAGLSALPPVVFIHGACLGAWCWQDHFVAYFNALGYPTVTFDLRGHGASEGHEELATTSIDDYVADVEQVVRSLPSPPVIVGHSMGGLIAQRFADRNPLQALVLLASSPTEGMQSYGRQLFWSHPIAFIKVLATRQLAHLYSTDKKLRHVMFSPFTDADVVVRCRQRIQNESWRAAMEMNEPMPLLENIRCEVLVVGGEHDNAVPQVAVENTARRLKADMQIIKNAGHNLMLEHNWQSTADTIQAWLESALTRKPDQAN